MLRRLGLVLFIFLSSSIAAHAGDLAPYKADQFASALKGGKTIVVHVHADWCPTCHRQLPALNALAKDPDLKKVSFIQVNYDNDGAFLKAHRVSGQSTILVFRAGKEVKRIIGVTDAGQITSTIKGAVS